MKNSGRLARRHMRKERLRNTLQTTALVHEAYLRLADARAVDWKDRALLRIVGGNHAADTRGRGAGTRIGQARR